jgi:rRNA processing protein Krr1/Pno1
MTQTTDNIIDRDQLQEAYIESIIDGMDHKTMYQFVYDSRRNLSSVSELRERRFFINTK